MLNSLVRDNESHFLLPSDFFIFLIWKFLKIVS
jgi:hypothetical protein